MVIKEIFLICDGGCGARFGVDNRGISATQQRKSARGNGWRLVVGDGFKYGDYCPECLKQNKHKKPLKQFN
jgi:hypothetical protein